MNKTEATKAEVFKEKRGMKERERRERSPRSVLRPRSSSYTKDFYYSANKENGSAELR